MLVNDCINLLGEVIIAYLVIALVVCLAYNVGSLLKRQLDLNCNPENHEHYDEYEWYDFIPMGCIYGTGWALFVGGYLIYAFFYVTIHILYYVCYHGYQIMHWGKPCSKRSPDNL